MNVIQAFESLQADLELLPVKNALQLRFLNQFSDFQDLLREVPYTVAGAVAINNQKAKIMQDLVWVYRELKNEKVAI